MRIILVHGRSCGLAIASLLFAFAPTGQSRTVQSGAPQMDPSAASRVYVVALPDDDAEEPETVEVYATDNEEAREEAARDLQLALSHEDYRSAVQVVDSPDFADVIVEIPWRGSAITYQRVMFGPIPSGGGVSVGTPQRIAQDNLLVRVYAGERETELFAIEPGDKTFLGQVRMLSTRQLANEAAARIVAWIGGEDRGR